jgi:hypothetical protein
MKKKVWVILSIVLVIAALVAVYFLFFNKEGSASGKETIQVPDGGPKVEVRFEGPAELEMTWNEVGIKSYQFFVDGVLTNISKNTVVTIEAGGVTFFLDSTPQGVWNPFTEYTLNPGESVGIKAGFPIIEAKAFIVKVKARTSVISTPTETETIETPTEAIKPATTTPVYEKNPSSPGETMINFVVLCEKKEYEKAIRETIRIEITPGDITTFQQSWEKVNQGEKLISIEIIKEEINGNLAFVELEMYFTDDFHSKWDVNMEYSEGRWWIIE